MSTTCKYCNEAEDKQSKPGLLCYGCMNFVHLTCLRRPGTPGDFACDVFFEFTCESCSPDKCELFARYKFPWVNVIYLTLNHLCTQSYGISHHGYFHYKTHICSFIDRYWQGLFGTSNKQKKNWIGTIAGVLSVYNKLFFKSGSTVLGETGWWRLLHNFSPAVAAHIIQEMARDKPKNRPRNQQAMDRNHFLAKICEMGYKDLIKPDIDEALETEPPPVPCKKKRVDSADSAVSGGSYFDQVDSDSGRYEMEEQSCSDSIQISLSEYSMPQELDLNGFKYTSVSKITQGQVQSDTSSVHSYNQSSTFYYDSDSRSGSEHDKKPFGMPKKTVDKSKFRKESLFSTQLNSKDLPWEENLASEIQREAMESDPKQLLTELTQYEEVQLMKQVENLIVKVKEPSKKAYLQRLRAKLALRRLKRHKHLPLFNLDKTVQILGGYATEDLGNVNTAERVLDRFQISYLQDQVCGTICGTHAGTTLLARAPTEPLRSARSGAALRPYIRRDVAARPAWVELTRELLRRTHRHIPHYRPPPRAPLDYSYVRPEHIAAVNSLCAQFFWPGINLTEALQYPEFSCVASYKRLAVGCAFLVPDSNRNEAYISFILTRPEWRRAGIATFMLYHLLQTCTGKDVTLHCSPTNPAIFLYQKFGFKVEELVQDFYEKYFDIEYKGCRHALFLRLAR